MKTGRIWTDSRVRCAWCPQTFIPEHSDGTVEGKPSHLPGWRIPLHIDGTEECAGSNHLVALT